MTFPSWGDTATAVGALRRAADGERRVASVMFVPATLTALACMAAALRYAEGVMAWNRGELADAEHLVREATVQWHRCCDRMGACDGIELAVQAASQDLTAR